VKTQTPYDCCAGIAGFCFHSPELNCLVGRLDRWNRGYHGAGLWTGNGGKTPMLPAPHDISASQSEAARYECVVPESAPHDLLSSGGRNNFSSDYRFGFNDQENDNDGNVVDTISVEECKKIETEGGQ